MRMKVAGKAGFSPTDATANSMSPVFLLLGGWRGGGRAASDSNRASWLPETAEYQSLNAKSKSFKIQYSLFH